MKNFSFQEAVRRVEQALPGEELKLDGDMGASVISNDGYMLVAYLPKLLKARGEVRNTCPISR
jgi:hypothetical protein